LIQEFLTALHLFKQKWTLKKRWAESWYNKIGAWELEPRTRRWEELQCMTLERNNCILKPVLHQNEWQKKTLKRLKNDWTEFRRLMIKRIEGKKKGLRAHFSPIN
jgi:hypothetical protein